MTGLLIVSVVIVVFLCAMWYRRERKDLERLPHVVQPQGSMLSDNAVTTCKLPGGFEHSEEEAYNLKYALVSLVVYGGLPDDVVEEILDNVYAQEQPDFPDADEGLPFLLFNLFDFRDSPEGIDYWNMIDDQLDELIAVSRDPQVEAWIREALE